MLRWCIFDVSLHLCSLARPRSGRHCASWFFPWIRRVLTPLPSFACSCTDTGRVVGVRTVCSSLDTEPQPLSAWRSTGRRVARLLRWWAGVSAACLCSGPLRGEPCVRRPPPPRLRVFFAGKPQVCGRAVRTRALSWHAAGKRPGGTTGDRSAGPPYGAHLPCRLGAATATHRLRAAGFAPGLGCGKIPSKRPFLLFVWVRVIKSWCCFHLHSS